MEPVLLCRYSAFEALHMLRSVGVAPHELDPSQRLEPLRLKRSSVAVSPHASSEQGVARLMRPDAPEPSAPLPITAPAHVLVAGQASRRASDLRIPHRVPTDLLPCSFVELAPGLYASSPERLFLEMAAHGLDHLGLIWLGSLLCATYAHLGPQDPIVSAHPLTCTNSLSSYLAKAARTNARGAQKALKALPHVVEGAASPREAMFVLMACLPLRMGGWNLPKPLINHAIEVDRRIAGASGCARYSVDLLWPQANLVAEYDSDLHHDDPARRARDNEKHAELQRRGYRVEAVSTKQLAHAEPTDRIMRRLAAALGVRPRICDCAYNWYDRRLDLRRRLWDFEANGIPWS